MASSEIEETDICQIDRATVSEEKVKEFNWIDEMASESNVKENVDYASTFVTHSEFSSRKEAQLSQTLSTAEHKITIENSFSKDFEIPTHINAVSDSFIQSNLENENSFHKELDVPMKKTDENINFTDYSTDIFGANSSSTPHFYSSQEITLSEESIKNAYWKGKIETDSTVRESINYESRLERNSDFQPDSDAQSNQILIRKENFATGNSLDEEIRIPMKIYDVNDSFTQGNLPNDISVHKDLEAPMKMTYVSRDLADYYPDLFVANSISSPKQDAYLSETSVTHNNIHSLCSMDVKHDDQKERTSEVTNNWTVFLRFDEKQDIFPQLEEKQIDSSTKTQNNYITGRVNFNDYTLENVNMAIESSRPANNNKPFHCGVVSSLKEIPTKLTLTQIKMRTATPSDMQFRHFVEDSHERKASKAAIIQTNVHRDQLPASLRFPELTYLLQKEITPIVSSYRNPADSEIIVPQCSEVVQRYRIDNDNNITLFKCNVCNGSYLSRPDIVKHVTSAHDSFLTTPFHQSRNSLSQTVNNKQSQCVTKKDTPPFKCGVCNRSLLTNSWLRRHMKNIHGHE